MNNLITGEFKLFEVNLADGKRIIGIDQATDLAYEFHDYGMNGLGSVAPQFYLNKKTGYRNDIERPIPFGLPKKQLLPITPFGRPRQTIDLVETRGGAFVDKELAIRARGGQQAPQTRELTVTSQSQQAQNAPNVTALGKGTGAFWNALPGIASSIGTIVGAIRPQQNQTAVIPPPNYYTGGNRNVNTGGSTKEPMSMTTMLLIGGGALVAVGLATGKI
jgi:hypothetical protein